MKWVEVVSKELKKCPPPSPAILWFVNGCERKQDIYKKRRLRSVFWYKSSERSFNNGNKKLERFSQNKTFSKTIISGTLNCSYHETLVIQPSFNVGSGSNPVHGVHCTENEVFH